MDDRVVVGVGFGRQDLIFVGFKVPFVPVDLVDSAASLLLGSEGIEELVVLDADVVLDLDCLPEDFVGDSVLEAEREVELLDHPSGAQTEVRELVVQRPVDFVEVVDSVFQDIKVNDSDNVLEAVGGPTGYHSQVELLDLMLELRMEFVFHVGRKPFVFGYHFDQLVRGDQGLVLVVDEV